MKKLGKMTFGLAMLALAACGPMNKGGMGEKLAIVASLRGTAPAAPDTNVPAEVLLANPGKYMRVNIRDQGIWTAMVVGGENNGRVTWVDASNLSVTVSNGLVVATRGLSRDLMGADVAASWFAVQRGGGTAERRHDFLTDQDRISTELLQCSIVLDGTEVVARGDTGIQTRRFNEKCEGENLTFSNVYWVNASGNMVRSLQAVSPSAGYLQIDVF